MGVAQHGIEAPASNDADGFPVHARVEDGHCTGGANRFGEYILGEEANGWA